MTPRHVLLLLTTFAVAPQSALPLSDEELEQAHAVIGAVYIDNQGIFNLREAAEGTMLFRIADSLHVTTRASVIGHQLLFHPGDVFTDWYPLDLAFPLDGESALMNMQFLVETREHFGAVHFLLDTHFLFSGNSRRLSSRTPISSGRRVALVA